MATAVRTGAFLLVFVAGMVVGTEWIEPVGVAQAAQLSWWSHWATEENNKIVLLEVAKKFEAQHPGNTVKITFYEKANMWPALRATFAAGSGFPDLFYFDRDALEFISAGWLADLSTAIRLNNIEPFAKDYWTLPGPGGKVGMWAVPVQTGTEEIYYNKKLVRQLGITVPANHAFTQDEFKRVVATCAKAGYAAFAAGAADRDWGALFLPSELLLSKLGAKDLNRLALGEMSWKDSRVVEVFRYYKELIDLGAYAKTFSSMGLADGHRYFYTEQKACMFPYNSSYVARAFVPPAKGGQPEDFELGIVNYPLMKDGKGHGEKFLTVGGSLSVAAKSPNLPLALELANTFADPEIGNLWMSKTSMLTGIKSDMARVESPRKAYLKEYTEVNKNSTMITTGGGQGLKLEMPPGVWAVWVAVMNQGLPNKLIGVDAALDKMEQARLKGR
jgi:multiple sugar transport system substrate-binding protein